jgi:hypothetical protein
MRGVTRPYLFFNHGFAIELSRPLFYHTNAKIKFMNYIRPYYSNSECTFPVVCYFSKL